jgi:hypothetical protein
MAAITEVNRHADAEPDDRHLWMQPEEPIAIALR